MPEAKRIPCPFKYANGKPCTGEVVRVEAYKADLAWWKHEGSWHFDYGRPRSHFHVFCSEKGNHAGMRSDDSRMKFYYDQLPAAIQTAMSEGEKGQTPE